MKARDSLLLGFGMIALANILGGATFPAQKLALNGLPPATITAFRNIVALLPLVFLATRASARAGGAGFLGIGMFSRRDLGRVLLIGTLAFAAPLLLGIVGTRYSSSANASILLLVEPPMILFFSWLLLHERIRARVVVGIVLGLLGAGWIVIDGKHPETLLEGDLLFGNALLALHGLLWGLHTPLSKPLATRVAPFILVTWVVVSSLVLLVPAALFELAHFERTGPILPALLWSAALGLFGTVASLGLWFAALKYIPSSSVAPFLFLQPLVGVLVGVFWLDEPMTNAIMIGGAILVAGVLFTLGGKRIALEPQGGVGTDSI